MRFILKISSTSIIFLTLIIFLQDCIVNSDNGIVIFYCYFECVGLSSNLFVDIIGSLKRNFSLLTFEQYESLMVFERSVAKAEFARIKCVLGSEKNNECLNCICSDNGTKWRCKSYVNEACSWGTYEGTVLKTFNIFLSEIRQRFFLIKN